MNKHTRYAAAIALLSIVFMCSAFPARAKAQMDTLPSMMIENNDITMMMSAETAHPLSGTDVLSLDHAVGVGYVQLYAGTTLYAAWDLGEVLGELTRDTVAYMTLTDGETACVWLAVNHDIVEGYLSAGALTLLDDMQIMEHEDASSMLANVQIVYSAQRKVLLAPSAFYKGSQTPEIEQTADEDMPITTQNASEANVLQGTVAPVWLGTAVDIETLPVAKSVLTAITDALQAKAQEIDLQAYALSPQSVHSALQQALDGDMSLFFVGDAYTLDTRGNTVKILYPTYRIDGEQLEAETKRVELLMTQLTSDILPSMATEEKVLVVHDALVEYHLYDSLGATDSANLQRLGGGQGSAFAMAFKMAMDQIDVNCEIVRSSAMEHIWNMVLIGKSWYHVDAAYDSDLTSVDSISHEYMLVSEEKLRTGNRPHEWGAIERVANAKLYDEALWDAYPRTLPVFTGNAALVWEGAYVPYSSDADALYAAANHTQSFDQVVGNALDGCAQSVDIRAFKLSKDQFAQVYQAFLNLNPQYFYVTGDYYLVYEGSTDEAVELYPAYIEDDLQSLYKVKRSIEQDIISLLDFVKPEMSAVEKVLTVHDELSFNYRYDENAGIYSPSTLMAQGTGTSHAFAALFKYALDNVGITCKVVSSESMQHAWNMVRLGGNWYHVDVTCNDSSMIKPMGFVDHAYLLCSDSYMESMGYSGWESDVKAKNKVYDDFFWNRVYARFTYLEGNSYYVDELGNVFAWKESANLHRQLYDGEEKYWPSSTGAWRSKFANVLAMGERLYISLPDRILSILPDGSNEVLELKLTLPEQHAIYALDGTGDTLRYWVQDNAYNWVTQYDEQFTPPAYASKLFVSPRSMVIDSGVRIPLTLQVEPQSAIGLLQFASDNETMVSVSDTGEIVAIREGAANITVSAHGVEPITIAVRILRAPNALYIDEETIEMSMGDSYQPVVRVEPDDLSDTRFTYASSDEQVASVSEDGVIHAHAAGSAEITVTAQNGVHARVWVAVQSR